MEKYTNQHNGNKNTLKSQPVGNKMITPELKIINKLNEDNYEESGYLYTKIKQILDMEFPGNRVNKPSDLPDYIYSLCQHTNRSYGKDVTSQYSNLRSNKHLKAFIDKSINDITLHVVMPEMIVSQRVNPIILNDSKVDLIGQTFDKLHYDLSNKISEFAFDNEANRFKNYYNQKLNLNIVLTNNVSPSTIFIHPADYHNFITVVTGYW